MKMWVQIQGTLQGISKIASAQYGIKIGLIPRLLAWAAGWMVGPFPKTWGDIILQAWVGCLPPRYLSPVRIRCYHMVCGLRLWHFDTNQLFFPKMAIREKETCFLSNHLFPIKTELFINVVKHMYYCTFLKGYRIMILKNHKPTYTYSNTWAPLLLISCSVMSDSLQPHGLQCARVPYWNANGMRTRVFSIHYFATDSPSKEKRFIVVDASLIQETDRSEGAVVRGEQGLDEEV